MRSTRSSLAWPLIHAIFVAVPSAWSATENSSDSSIDPEPADAKAQFELARVHLFGRGVPRDAKKAFDLMQKAADQHYPDALGGLGYFYARGLAVEKNETTAVEWFRKGAEKNSPKAQLNLGKMLLEGKGVSKDEAEGWKWIEKAADQGLMEAIYEMGETLYLGRHGQNVDAERAYPLLLKAAEAGNPFAQNIVGVMCEYGQATVVDLDKAEQWYRKSALQGNLKAQSALGHLIGPFSTDRARRIESWTWLTVASRLGEITATKTLANVVQRADAGELNEARQKATKLESTLRFAAFRSRPVE